MMSGSYAIETVNPSAGATLVNLTWISVTLSYFFSQSKITPSTSPSA